MSFVVVILGLLIRFGMKLVLFIVEDNEDVWNFLWMSFEFFFIIVEVENGEVGIVKVLEMLLDVIFSDIMMFKKSGIELC